MGAESPIFWWLAKGPQSCEEISHTAAYRGRLGSSCRFGEEIEAPWVAGLRFGFPVWSLHLCPHAEPEMMNVMTVEQELCIRMLSQRVDKIDRNVGPTNIRLSHAVARGSPALPGSPGAMRSH